MRQSDSASDSVSDRDWEVVVAPTATRQLQRLSHTTARDIVAKIEWLRANVENIRHERLKGGEEYSLHSGQFRIPYTLDRAQRRISILDVAKHDEAYRRLRRRR